MGLKSKNSGEECGKDGDYYVKSYKTYKCENCKKDDY